jgi:hypothetical protein
MGARTRSISISAGPLAEGIIFPQVHGAGSYGHFQASQYGVARGGNDAAAAVQGFVETRRSVTQLNHAVVSALIDEGVPAVGLSPCGTWSCSGRQLQDAAAGIAAVQAALEHHLVRLLISMRNTICVCCPSVNHTPPDALPPETTSAVRSSAAASRAGQLAGCMHCKASACSTAWHDCLNSKRTAQFCHLHHHLPYLQPKSATAGLLGSLALHAARCLCCTATACLTPSWA